MHLDGAYLDGPGHCIDGIVVTDYGLCLGSAFGHLWEAVPQHPNKESGGMKAIDCTQDISLCSLQS